MQHTVRLLNLLSPFLLTFINKPQFKFYVIASLKRSRPPSRHTVMKNIRQTSLLTFFTVHNAAKVLSKLPNPGPKTQYITAYTSQQIHTLTQLGEALSLPAGQKSGPFESFEAICNTSDSSQMLEITDGTTTSVGQQPGFNGSLDDLAKEFGVDAQVVQALAQRLSGLR